MTCRTPLRTVACVCLAAVCSAVAVAAAEPAALPEAGIRVDILKGAETARIMLQPVGRFEVRMDLDPGAGREAVTIRVQVAESGGMAWPAEDLRVADEKGEAVPIRRNGTDLHRFEMTIPPARASYVVRALPLEGVRPAPESTSESNRTVTDSSSGLSAAVCNWYGGRKAALSIRFDDSHPTHLSRVIPLLRENGLRATFMINPGSRDFREHREEWESCARRGDQEFANHTLHHSGAETDEEVEREIGESSVYIWSLFPQRSKLVALNLGGGTTWITRRPFRYYLEKYHLFNVSGSLGMDDVYRNRVEALEQALARHIERGIWCRVHYHSVGEKSASSEENFLAAIRLVKRLEEQLWITGLADAWKYLQERNAARLALSRRDPECFSLRLSCGTDPVLFDQPLTIRLEMPGDWRFAMLRPVRAGQAGSPVPPASDAVREPARNVLYFHVPPVSGDYLIERRP